MSLEHFAEGANSGRLTPIVTVLGHTAQVKEASRVPGPSQANRLYAAEGALAPFSRLGKWISPSSAKELVEESVFHPAMDEIPGIDKVRQEFHPDNVSFDRTFPDERISGATTHKGHVHLVPISPQLLEGLTSKHPKIAKTFGTNTDLSKAMGNIGTGTVTHEATHLILNGLGNDLRKQGGHGIGHDWPMARTHVHLIRHLLSNRHADALKDFYTKRGVNFGNEKV